MQARRAYDSFAAVGEATPLLPRPLAGSRPLGGDPRRSAGCGGGAGLAAAASGMVAVVLGFLCLVVVLVQTHHLYNDGCHHRSGNSLTNPFEFSGT